MGPKIGKADIKIQKTYLKCNVCKKTYISERKLINHQQNKHIIVKEHSKQRKKKRVSFSNSFESIKYHRCRKCIKTFRTYQSLKAHMKDDHKKRKCYICNYCTKSFVDRIFFKVHIKLHCDDCGELLPNKSQFFNHKRNICRMLRLQCCQLCDDIYFTMSGLKDHGLGHVEKSLYYCNFCKDKFRTKCTLSHHLSFLHFNNRPADFFEIRNLGSDRLYLCRFCDESSVDREMIEKHVQLLPDLSNRIISGEKDYYKCDQCTNTFDSEKELLRHKWSHFLPLGGPNTAEDRTDCKNLNSFTVNDIPDRFKPIVLVRRLQNPEKYIDQLYGKNNKYVDNNNLRVFENANGLMCNKQDGGKFSGVKEKSKKITKTVMSKYQCEICSQYYSSNYCLNRHVETQHGDLENLRCNVCEETFLWPSLLRNHKCVRNKMAYENKTSGIHFENLILTPLTDSFEQQIDELSIADDFLNEVDFEIPAPIVELTEYENSFVFNKNGLCEGTLQMNSENVVKTSSLGYKVIMQEVPIEFVN